MAHPIPATPTGPTPHRADVKRVLVRTSAAVIGSVLLSGGVEALFLLLLHKPAWWGSWLAALVAGLAAAVVSIVPLVPGFLGGAQAAVYAYLAAGVLRMLVTLGICMAAVFVAPVAPVPTLLLAVPIYFVQVAAEALVLSRAFWPGK